MAVHGDGLLTHSSYTTHRDTTSNHKRRCRAFPGQICLRTVLYGVESFVTAGGRPDGYEFRATTSSGGLYRWSTAANWTNGVPVNGSTAVVSNTSFAGNPSSYDDIANLYLDGLNVSNTYLGVAGALEAGTVSFGTFPSELYSSTIQGGGAATLTIDGFAGTAFGYVDAFGPNALTEVLAPTDFRFENNAEAPRAFQVGDIDTKYIFHYQIFRRLDFRSSARAR